MPGCSCRDSGLGTRDSRLGIRDSGSETRAPTRGFRLQAEEAECQGAKGAKVHLSESRVPNPEVGTPGASVLSGTRDEAAHSFSERGRLDQQADDQKGLVTEVEEESRVDEYPVPLEQLEDEILLRPRRRHTQDG